MDVDVDGPLIRWRTHRNTSLQPALLDDPTWRTDRKPGVAIAALYDNVDKRA